MRHPAARRWLLPALAIAVTTACSGSSTPYIPGDRTPPNLKAFLRLPVATPSSCATAPGSTAGRSSPWVGHVDVSVFVADGADAMTKAALRDSLLREPHVTHIYSETKAQAIAEFQRLYTCSAQVPRSALLASYRLVLERVSVPQRDALVRRIYHLRGVESVSCDPSSPCVDVRR